jgi:hypothetical protein
MCNINISLTRKHEKQITSYNFYGSYICECTHVWTLKLELKMSLECKWMHL